MVVYMFCTRCGLRYHAEPSSRSVAAVGSASSRLITSPTTITSPRAVDSWVR